MCQVRVCVFRVYHNGGTHFQAVLSDYKTTQSTKYIYYMHTWVLSKIWILHTWNGHHHDKRHSRGRFLVSHKVLYCLSRKFVTARRITFRSLFQKMWMFLSGSNDGRSACKNILRLRINFSGTPHHYENCKIKTWKQKLNL